MEQIGKYIKMTPNKIADFLDEKVLGKVAPGYAISLIRDGQTEQQCSGTMAENLSTEISPHSVYDLASISKLYTSALLLKAVENGQLGLNDQVGKYLPNFAKSKLTIKDLMTHHVDFGFGMGEQRAKADNGQVFKENLLAIIPPTEPLNGVNYHNLGYIYLGFILEQIFHQTLSTQLRCFLDEEGLTETYTGDALPVVVNTVPTEKTAEGDLHNLTNDESARLLGGQAGNAGIFASTGDLAQFACKWLNTTMFSHDTIRQVFTEYDGTGEKSQGLCWWGRIYGQKQLQPGVYCHPGYTGSIVFVRPEKRNVCVFQCNRTYYGRDNDKHHDIFRFLSEII